MTILCRKCGWLHDCSVCPACSGFGTQTRPEIVTDELIMIARRAYEETTRGECADWDGMQAALVTSLKHLRIIP